MAYNIEDGTKDEKDKQSEEKRYVSLLTPLILITEVKSSNPQIDNQLYERGSIANRAQHESEGT